MHAAIILLVLCVGAATALPKLTQRIVGGVEATVNQYPEIASLLYSSTGTNYRQACGGTILTTKVVMTAAHCVYGDSSYHWRVRVGSSYANSGGSVYSVASITVHPSYDYTTSNNDVALIKTATAIVYSTIVRAGSIAGATYNLTDNQVVWAAGWGRTSVSGSVSEQLRHVQVWTINQALCKATYASIQAVVTDNMLCSGWINVGGRDQCAGDSGSPLYHNGVVVGICSWGQGCADARYPGVNTRVSRFTTWIQANA